MIYKNIWKPKDLPDFIETMWWKLTKKKDPLIKKALEKGIIEERKHDYLLQKDWELYNIVMKLDKFITIRESHDAHLKIEQSIIISRGAKIMFNYIIKKKES